MRSYFASLSKQINAEVEAIRTSLSHPGMKGSAMEEVAKESLSKYLPRRYRVGQGKVVDALGAESHQIDIIVMDAVNTVPLYIDAERMIVPIESVFAVIEIKTTLTRDAFFEAYENVLSIHGLMMPEEYLFVRGGVVAKRRPPNEYPRGYVLGMRKSNSLSIKTLTKHYLKAVRDAGIRFPLISSCAVLGSGYFVDIPGPSHLAAGSETYEEAEAGEDTLLLFLLNVVATLSEMSDRALPPFDLYLNSFGRVVNSKTTRGD